jgi:hypothetical protein
MLSTGKPALTESSSDDGDEDDDDEDGDSVQEPAQEPAQWDDDDDDDDDDDNHHSGSDSSYESDLHDEPASRVRFTDREHGDVYGTPSRARPAGDESHLSDSHIPLTDLELEDDYDHLYDQQRGSGTSGHPPLA